MNFTGEERAYRQHYTRCTKLQPYLRNHTLHQALFNNQVGDFLLEQRQIRLVFQNFANGLFVQLAIRLRACGTNCRAFTAVERTKLNAGTIGGLGHRPAEGINFFDQMTFANAANGRITAHLSERFDALRQQQGLHAHTRSRQRCLGSGMASAYNNDLKLIWITHGCPPRRAASLTKSLN